MRENIIHYRPTFNVVINPSIADEITYKVRYNLVEFEGSEWDVQFKKYYNITPNNSYTVYCTYIPSKRSGYDPSPTVIQNEEKGTKVKLAYYDYPIVLSDIGVYIGSSSVYTETFSVYYNTVFSYMASYNRTDTNSFPLSISNAYFNGKPVLYVANLGVNVTVTMTVKSTGQEIISSRTYLPEYNIKFQ